MTDARGEVHWSGQYCSFGEVRYQPCKGYKACSAHGDAASAVSLRWAVC
ncbi:hypothetical protein V5037_15280 [Enterobacter ludwigii]